MRARVEIRLGIEIDEGARIEQGLIPVSLHIHVPPIREIH